MVDQNLIYIVQLYHMPMPNPVWKCLLSELLKNSSLLSFMNTNKVKKCLCVYVCLCMCLWVCVCFCMFFLFFSVCLCVWRPCVYLCVCLGMFLCVCVSVHLCHCVNLCLCLNLNLNFGCVVVVFLYVSLCMYC